MSNSPVLIATLVVFVVYSSRLVAQIGYVHSLVSLGAKSYFARVCLGTETDTADMDVRTPR